MYGLLCSRKQLSVGTHCLFKASPPVHCVAPGQLHMKCCSPQLYFPTFFYNFIYPRRAQRLFFCSAPRKRWRQLQFFCANHCINYFFSCLNWRSMFNLPVTSPLQPSARRQLAALCLKCHILHENKSRATATQQLLESLSVFSFRWRRQRPFFILSALFVQRCDASNKRHTKNYQEIRESDERVSSATAVQVHWVQGGVRDWGVHFFILICVTFHSSTFCSAAPSQELLLLLIFSPEHIKSSLFQTKKLH